MSFKDLSQGSTGIQLKESRDAENRFEQSALDLANFYESEHVLNILRKIQPKNDMDDKTAFKKWKGVLNAKHCTTTDQFAESFD